MKNFIEVEKKLWKAFSTLIVGITIAAAILFIAFAITHAVVCLWEYFSKQNAASLADGSITIAMAGISFALADLISPAIGGRSILLTLWSKKHGSDNA